MNESEICAVILTVDPSHLLDACLRSVQFQSFPPVKIEIIRNVMPVCDARRDGLALVSTEYVVFVDDDMILDADCFKRLHELMLQNQCAGDVALPLDDPLVGKLMGVHMYRTHALRKIGFGHERELDELRWISRKMIEQGYSVLDEAGAPPAGIHHPVYLPHEAYWKYVVRAHKSRLYSDGYPKYREAITHLCTRWVVTQDAVLLYALAGLLDGLRGEASLSEFTYHGRMENPGYKSMMLGLRAMKGYDEGLEKGVGIPDADIPREQFKRLQSEIGSTGILAYFDLVTIFKHLLRRMLKCILPENVYAYLRFQRGAL